MKASDLVALFRQALAEEWGYIWGKSGQVWTASAQASATRDMTVRYGSKWVGRKVADCSGLFVWAFKQLGESIYHGSNTIWNKHLSLRGAIAGEIRIRPGTAVFQVADGKRGHIGLYVGDGWVIEAKGTQSGVVQSRVDSWDEWGELFAVDYSGEYYDSFFLPPADTLRKGMTGEHVRWLQQSLNELGYGLDADGVFGSGTEAAVRAFQADRGLSPDGVAGKKTYAALRASAEQDEPDSTPKPAPELTLEERIARLEKAVFGGGEADG